MLESETAKQSSPQQNPAPAQAHHMKDLKLFFFLRSDQWCGIGNYAGCEVQTGQLAAACLVLKNCRRS